MTVAIEDLNQLSREAFVATLQPLFESADQLAEVLYARRPFGSYAALLETAEALAFAMPADQQVTLLSAHPRIGARPETLSAASYREQGYAIQPADTVDAHLAELNQEYEARFGFRFVVFVDRRPRAEIVRVLRERLHNTRETELETGLRAIFLIARDRLAAAP